MSRYSTNTKPHGANRGAFRNRHTGQGWQGNSTPARADVLLSRLDNVHKAGREWRARCPVHGGKDALSVRESDSGHVLVRCHAQCDTGAIVAAVGLSLADLCPARERGERLSPADEAQAAILLANERRRRQAKEAAEEAARHAAAADAARARWELAGLANPRHPYLCAKNVGAHGIRETGGLLLVPLCDGAGVLWNVQSIAGDGAKRFASGARKRGLWHLIGRNVASCLCVAEGYATAATVHEATGYPVAVAFDAGNLEPVARALRALYPEARMVICADDDAATAERRGHNPGIEKAEAAARAVGGTVARPKFGGGQ